MIVCGCPRDALCDACFRRDLAQLGGCARARGIRWADRVARSRPRSRPWWTHEGRAAELALEHVADLSRDPRLLAALAEECAAGARGQWEKPLPPPGTPYTAHLQ